jgi:hypothetical protein
MEIPPASPISSSCSAFDPKPLPLHLRKLQQTSSPAPGVNPFSSSLVMSPAPKASSSVQTTSNYSSSQRLPPSTSISSSFSPSQPLPTSVSLLSDDPKKPRPLHLVVVTPPSPALPSVSSLPPSSSTPGPPGFFVVRKRKGEARKGEEEGEGEGEGEGELRLEDLDNLLKSSPLPSSSLSLPPSPSSTFFVAGNPIPLHCSPSSSATLPTPAPSAATSLTVPSLGKTTTKPSPLPSSPSVSPSLSNLKSCPPIAFSSSSSSSLKSSYDTQPKLPKQPELRGKHSSPPLSLFPFQTECTSLHLGASKDRTSEFQNLRSTHRRKLEDDINEMLTNLARLSLLRLELDGKKGGSNISMTPKPKRKLEKCARCSYVSSLPPLLLDLEFSSFLFSSFHLTSLKVLLLTGPG